MKFNHQIGFEDKAKYMKALRYMIGRYKGFQTAHLKHILKIFDPALVDRITTRRECIRTLIYVGKSSEQWTNGKLYQSTTFNGSTYEVVDDHRDIALIGSSYFELIDDMKIQK